MNNYCDYIRFVSFDISLKHYHMNERRIVHRLLSEISIITELCSGPSSMWSGFCRMLIKLSLKAKTAVLKAGYCGKGFMMARMMMVCTYCDVQFQRLDQ